jgi:hypothetical protein
MVVWKVDSMVVSTAPKWVARKVANWDYLTAALKVESTAATRVACWDGK